MLLKTFVVALFVVGVFADEFEFTEERKEQMKGLLRTQCEKVGAGDKVDEVAESVHTFVHCLQDLFNVTQVQAEIEAAKPNGALDEVFKKYCAKTPQLKTCIHNLFDGVKPCLEDGSTPAENIFSSSKNGTDQLIDFVCYKDGDRIALFIAEGGPQCFMDKKVPIRECANKMKESVPSAEAAKSLTLSERCAKYDQLSTCVVTALEGCTTPTPANMAESLLKYIRKASPCNAA